MFSSLLKYLSHFCTINLNSKSITMMMIKMKYCVCKVFDAWNKNLMVFHGMCFVVKIKSALSIGMAFTPCKLFFSKFLCICIVHKKDNGNVIFFALYLHDPLSSSSYAQLQSLFSHCSLFA